MKVPESHRIHVAAYSFSSNTTETKVQACFCLFSHTAGYLQRLDLRVLLSSCIFYTLSSELV